MKNVSFFTSVIFVLLIGGCNKENPVAAVNNDLPPSGAKGFYIVNEGNYSKSNSSLSFYSTDENKLYKDIYFAANKDTLGDVANDMVIFGLDGYIVMNNSQKIKVISTETQKVTGVISLPGKSPVKTVIVSSLKGYVTNLYDATVSVFNPTTYAKIKDISVGLNPQGIAVVNGKAYICNSGYGGDSTISVIDISTDAVIKTIAVNTQPTDIGVDAEGDIIVLCYGFSNFTDPSKDTPGSIVEINAQTDAVKSSIPLPLGLYGHPYKMAVSNKGYGFTSTSKGILKFSTVTQTIVNDTLIIAFPYGINVNNSTESIFIADPKDFQNNGEIRIYDKNGVLLSKIDAGKIPNGVTFKN